MFVAGRFSPQKKSIIWIDQHSYTGQPNRQVKEQGSSSPSDIMEERPPASAHEDMTDNSAKVTLAPLGSIHYVARSRG